MDQLTLLRNLVWLSHRTCEIFSCVVSRRTLTNVRQQKIWRIIPGYSIINATPKQHLTMLCRRPALLRLYLKRNTALNMEQSKAPIALNDALLFGHPWTPFVSDHKSTHCSINTKQLSEKKIILPTALSKHLLGKVSREQGLMAAELVSLIVHSFYSCGMQGLWWSIAWTSHLLWNLLSDLPRQVQETCILMSSQGEWTTAVLWCECRCILSRCWVRLCLTLFPSPFCVSGYSPPRSTIEIAAEKPGRHPDQGFHRRLGSSGQIQPGYSNLWL